MFNKCAKLFADFLDSQNLKYSSAIDSNGDSVVEFPYKGKSTKLFFNGENGEYLSIYLVYENVPEEKRTNTILSCNELNNQFKWVTFYVDKDNDVILHSDAILSPSSANNEAFELLLRIIQISDEAKPTIMKAIYA